MHCTVQRCKYHLWFWSLTPLLMSCKNCCALHQTAKPLRHSATVWHSKKHGVAIKLTFLWPKKHNSVSTFCRNWEEQEPRPPACTLSTEAPSGVLTSCITVRYGASTISCRQTLQRTVNVAEKTIAVSLPSLSDIYHTRQATRTAGDPINPSHCLFSMLPSGRRLWSLWGKNRCKVHLHTTLIFLKINPWFPSLVCSINSCCVQRRSREDISMWQIEHQTKLLFSLPPILSVS